MSSLWDVDAAEGSSPAVNNTNEPKPKTNNDQAKMLQDLNTRLEQVEAALKTSEARVEQVEACRKVSDAKVELLESKLKTTEVKMAEMTTNLKASEAQLGQFKTYLKASDEKVKQLQKDLVEANFELNAQNTVTLMKTKDKIDILREEKQKMQKKLTNLNSELNNVDSQMNKKMDELRATVANIRKQMRHSCIEMEQTRKKIIFLNFNQPLTTEQQKKVNNDLWIAAKQGDIKLIRDALDNGADINCKLNKGMIDNLNHDNCTPLLTASSYGNAFAAEYLLLRGSSVNEITTKNSNALHFASLRGHYKVISVLLDYEAAINKVNKYNFTPLHYASFWGRPTSVRILLERGADTSILNNRNLTALGEAELSDTSQANAVKTMFQQFASK